LLVSQVVYKAACFRPSTSLIGTWCNDLTQERLAMQRAIVRQIGVQMLA